MSLIFNRINNAKKYLIISSILLIVFFSITSISRVSEAGYRRGGPVRGHWRTTPSGKKTYVDPHYRRGTSVNSPARESTSGNNILLSIGSMLLFPIEFIFGEIIDWEAIEYDLYIQKRQKVAETERIYNDGYLYYCDNKHDDAITSFHLLLKNEGYEAISYNWIGNIYYEKDKDELAIENLEKSISYESDHCVPYVNIGITYKENNQINEAAKYLQKGCDLGCDEACQEIKCLDIKNTDNNIITTTNRDRLDGP